MVVDAPEKPESAVLRREPGLRVVRLGGTPGELGLAHGQLLAREIREVRRALLSYLAKLTLWLGGLPLYLALAALAWRLRPFIPPPFWEEMQGVAAGARVALPLIVLINVFDDLAQNLPYCSAFAAGGGFSHTGDWLMGRNLDYAVFTEVMARLNTVFLLYPQEGIPLVSVAWPGYVGVCTGLSQKQIALAQLSAVTRDRTLRGCPAGFRNRQALQQGGNLAAVTQLIVKCPRTIGNNLLLCSPQEAEVLEVSAHNWARRQAENGLLIATNHYQSPELQPLQGRFPPRPPFSPLSPWHFTEAYSRSRQRRLQELAATGSVGVRQAQEMLADPEIANPGTVTSVVFEPEDLSLWVAQSLQTPVATGRWRRLGELFSDPGPRFDPPDG
jgi:hypothetical protein